MKTYTVNFPFFRREKLQWPRELHPRDTFTFDGQEYHVDLKSPDDQLWVSQKRMPRNS